MKVKESNDILFERFEAKMVKILGEESSAVFLMREKAVTIDQGGQLWGKYLLFEKIPILVFRLAHVEPWIHLRKQQIPVLLGFRQMVLSEFEAGRGMFYGQFWPSNSCEMLDTLAF